MSQKEKYFISFKKVDTLDQLDSLRAFAKEFDHYIAQEDLSAPIMMTYCENELIGYIIVVNRTIAFPAWHPEKSSPGIIKKAIKAFLDWAKLEAAFKNSDIIGFVAKSDDSPFTDDHMEKLGLENTGMKLFRVRGK